MIQVTAYVIQGQDYDAPNLCQYYARTRVTEREFIYILFNKLNEIFKRERNTSSFRNETSIAFDLEGTPLQKTLYVKVEEIRSAYAIEEWDMKNDSSPRLCIENLASMIFKKVADEFFKPQNQSPDKKELVQLVEKLQSNLKKNQELQQELIHILQSGERSRVTLESNSKEEK